MKNVLLLKDGDNWKVCLNHGNCNLSFNNIADAINCYEEAGLLVGKVMRGSLTTYTDEQLKEQEIKQRRELLGLETLTPEQLNAYNAKKNDDLETIKKAMSYQNDMMKQILNAVTVIKDSVVDKKDTKQDEVKDHRIKDLIEHTERLLMSRYQ